MESSEVPSQGVRSHKFFCETCQLTFSSRNNLNRHNRNFHSIYSISGFNQVCALCEGRVRTIADLHKHITLDHPEIQLEFEEKIFYCESDFEQWKSETERQSVSAFSLKSSMKQEDYKILYYYCHRSGNPRLKSDRKKRCKRIGSVKTGITCPAFIKVIKETVHEATQITVTYQSIHVGHECEVEKIPLQKEQRSILANMLSSGVPMNVILDKARAQFTLTKSITRKDLYNIARDFKIKNIVYKDDATAVDTLVKKYDIVHENSMSCPSSPADNGDNDEGMYLEIDVRENQNSENGEKSIILREIQRKPQMDFNYERMEIEQNWQFISNEVQTTESFADLKFVYHHLEIIRAYFNANKNVELQVPENSKTSPTNKKKNSQRQFKRLPKKKNKE